jgi:predicted nucleic acid-binding protein
MGEKLIVVTLIIFSALALTYSDFSSQRIIYDCTLNLNLYPKEIANECRQLIEEYRRQEEQKSSKIYI